MIFLDIIFHSLNAVVPLFIIGIIGYFFHKIRGIGEQTIEQINAFIFDILYPVQFFYSIYTGGIGNKFRISFLAVIFGGSFAAFGVSYLVAKKLTGEREKQGVLQQAFFRGNMVVFGTAIASSIFTPQQESFYLLAMAPILLIQNVGMMFGMHLFGIGDSDFSFVHSIRESIFSPQIVSIIIGVITVALGIKLPTIVDATFDSLSGVATPLCLMLIGAGMKIEKNEEMDIRLLMRALVIKIIVLPVIVFGLLCLLKLEFVEAFIVLLMFTAPPSLSVCVVSRRMKWDIQFASLMLVASTAAALVTLTIWIYLLQIVTV